MGSAKRLLDEISARLGALGIRGPDGVAWASPKAYLEKRTREDPWPELAATKQIFEWGSAHGVAPVILLLSQLAEQHVPGAPSVSEALRWVWASQPQRPNRYGWISMDGHLREANVFSWCTGDTGVALPCWLGATVNGLPEHAATALALGHSLAKRVIEGERPGVEKRIDLCCGLSGVLQSFVSWAAMSNDPVMAEASRRLLSRLVDEMSAIKTDDMTVDLQFGLAGIACTMVGLTTGIAPSWAGPLALALPNVGSPPAADSA